MSLTHLYRNEGANLTESSKFLPINWVWTTIGEIVHVIRGISFPKDVRSYKEEDGYVACLRTANVQQEVEWDDLWFVPARYVKRQDQIILPFDILISNANSLNLVGKVALVKYIPYKASLGAFISLMRVKEGINPRFVYFLISSSEIQAKIRNLASTTTNISNISTSKLVTVPIPLPPLPEQERIVARIESLFTRLDAGVAGLKRAQAALKRYKASVLKAACEGRLVPQDPNDVPAEALLQRILAENPARGGSRPASTDGELPALPEGWCWANVHWIALKMQYGTSEKADKDETGIIVLRMGNIQDGELNFGNVKYLPTNTIGLEQLVLEPGDLLFNRTNSAELVGKTAVYRENYPRATFASYLIRVIIHPDISPDYVSTYINSIFGRQYIKAVVSQQVGQANVNGTKLANMPIPLPPTREQQRIVAEVERRLSLVQELEAAISASLLRAARLRQAILKRAFEGRLLEQDPGDEPADVSLERLKAGYVNS